MNDTEKQVSSEKPLETILAPNFLQQIRQLSVPMWARAIALALAAMVLVVGILLVALGSLPTCYPDCPENLLDAGVKIVSVAFIPVLVLVYLVFAETGVRALKNKTKNLLEEIIPQLLQARDRSSDEGRTDGTQRFDASLELVGEIDGPTAKYRLNIRNEDDWASIFLEVDLNVYKANVVVFFPQEIFDQEGSVERVRQRIPNTIEGALHEGYSLDAHAITRHGLIGVCLRRHLAKDFLWDPAAKLYFAQDLRCFLKSLAAEWAVSIKHARN